MSQNLNQPNKRPQISKKDQLAMNKTKQVAMSTYKDFKEFVRPSTSAIQLTSGPRLLKMPKDNKNMGARFLNIFDEISLKDIKTYKDIPREKHMGPLEINYKYKVEDFYEKKLENIPSTASQTDNPRNKLRPSKERQMTSHGFRMAPANNLLQKVNPKLQVGLSPKVGMFRSSSAGMLTETIPSKRPGTQGHPFPEDFCIGNTLVRLSFFLHSRILVKITHKFSIVIRNILRKSTYLLKI